MQYKFAGISEAIIVLLLDKFNPKNPKIFAYEKSRYSVNTHYNIIHNICMYT